MIGVYDYDYFTYPNVIPNLECAKLMAYYRQKRELTKLAPQLEPARYSSFFIQKDYEDGIYPEEFFLNNVSYGGRAFSAKEYIPLPLEIEKMTPDFSSYNQYIEKFVSGKSPKDELANIKRVLRAVNLRLSVDGKHIDSFINPFQDVPPRCSGFIIHDYHPERIEGAYSLLKELSQVPSKNGKILYKIGMKFPVEVSTAKEFSDWVSLPPMPAVFSVQYNGEMEDKSVYEIANQKSPRTRQLLLNPAHGCKNDEEFMNRMVHVYRQILYLLSNKVNFLLVYDDFFPFSRELLDFIILLNCFIQFEPQGISCQNPDLIYYLRSAKERQADSCLFTEAGIVKIGLPMGRVREVFSFLREKNYQLFSLLYEAGKQYYEGGKIIGYDELRNQTKN